MAGGQLVIRFVGDARDFGRTAKTVRADIQGIGQTVGKSVGLWSAAGTLIGGVIKNISQRIIQFGIDSVKAWLESEKAIFQWEKAVERSALISEDFVDAGIQVANTLRDITGFSDEAILSVETTLSRFQLEEEQLRRLTPLVLDYARAKSIDVVSAGEAVAKALLGNAKALKSIGVNFKATGNRAQDVTNIMRLLEEQVGGTAREFGETLPGQIEIAQEKWDEFKENVGSLPARIFAEPRKALEVSLFGPLALAGDSMSEKLEELGEAERIAGLEAQGFSSKWIYMTNALRASGGYVENAAVSNRRLALSLEAAGASVGAFAGMTISEFKSWAGDVSGQISAVEGAMDALGDKGKLTANEVIKAFRKQAEAVANYDRNVQILAAKPSIGEKMLKFLLDQGEEGIELIDTLASTHGKKYNEMIASIREAMAADQAHRQTVKGLKNDLQTLPSDIYSTIHLSVEGATNALGLIGGQRASGGPVMAARTYLVGERGPELFVPNTAGKIIPNDKLASAGSSLSIHIPIYGDVYGVEDLEAKLEAAAARAFGRLLAEAAPR